MPEMPYPTRTAGVRLHPALMLLLGERSAWQFPWRLQRRRFRPHPRRFPQRRHAPLARRRGDRKRPHDAVAVPAHRKRTSAPRSRLSPDRAAAFAPRLEERVRRLPAVALAVAAEGGVRPHHLWPRADRRAAPFAHLALSATDRGRSQRHRQVRTVLCVRGPRHRTRPQAQCQPENGVGTVAARTGRCGRPNGRERADRAVGPAMPGAADLVLSLGAGAAGDPGAGQYRRRRRPADRRTRGANRQSAGRRRSP